MLELFKNIFKFVGLGTLPDLSSYEIEQRPRRNVNVKSNRTTTTRVNDGKAMKDDVEPDGTIVTTIGTPAPKTANEVKIDEFDAAFLDFAVGIKWKKDLERAAVMKWHWLKGHSARQIEVDHTDRKTGEKERGYSERTAAEYIKGFFDADDERERQGRPRMRAGRLAVDDGTKTVEW